MVQLLQSAPEVAPTLPLYDGPIWQLPPGIASGGEAGRAWVAPACASALGCGNGAPGSSRGGARDRDER
eukprot:3287619-Prymnesium_polylepis.1